MQPIFSRSEDINKMAFLNWRMNDYSPIRHLINMADGHLSSAIILAKQCLISNSDKKADILIFPIITNAHHGIELYLKAIIWSLNKILGLKTKIEGGHNIDQIYRTIRSKIKTLGGNDELKIFDEEMVELQSYLNELTAKIKTTSKGDNMDFSRYPISNDYTNHFYVDGLANVEIDLENFVRRFEKIYEVLDRLSEVFYDQRDDEDSNE